MIGQEAWPIDPAAIAPFVAAVAMVEITPGPNMAYLTMLSALHGRRAGMMAVGGVTFGLVIYMLAAVVGIAEVFKTNRFAYEVLRWCGVGYLFWLAYEAWSGAGETSPGDARGGAHPFLRGLVANLLNVKAAIFYLTLLPGFIAPDHGPPYRQALILGSAHILISVLVHSSIVMGAARANVFLTKIQDDVVAKKVRRVLATGIGLIALWLLWETRR